MKLIPAKKGELEWMLDFRPESACGFFAETGKKNITTNLNT